MIFGAARWIVAAFAVRPRERWEADHVRDAALCIAKLPKAEHDADEWQAAMEALMRIAEPERPPDLYIRSRAVAVPPISPRSLKAIMTDKLTKKGQGSENKSRPVLARS